MSTTLYRNGGLEAPETTLLATTGATPIVSASAKYIRVVEQIILANIDAATDCAVTLAWTDKTPTDRTFWQGTVVKGTTTIVEIPMLLHGEGKVRGIKATAATGGDIVATVITSAQSKQAPNAG